MSGFHEVLFPLDIGFDSRGGPQRRTDVVVNAGGREQRNQRWYHSRRKYNAGYGVKSISTLSTIVEFFEERRGKLYGFRWRDRADWKSSSHADPISHLDQAIGTGDGVRAAFQLIKRYGANHAPYDRTIAKPVAGSVRVAIDGVEVSAAAFSLDATTGIVTFAAGSAPAAGALVSAGFQFDTPVRFDTDHLEIDYMAFDAGEIPDIPVVEIITGDN